MRIEDLLQSFRDAHRDCISLGEQLARLESTLQTVTGKEKLLESFKTAHEDCISLREQLARLESTLQTVICKEKSEKRDKIIKKAKQEIVRINTSIGEALKGTQEILEEIYK